MHSKVHRRPVVEALAIGLAKSEWTSASANEAIQRLFRRKQAWVSSLVRRVLDQHPDRVKLEQLVRTIALDSELRERIKRDNIKPLDVGLVLSGSSVASLDWNLPTFESLRQMAGQFGISVRCLQWLTNDGLSLDAHPRHYVATWIRKRQDGFRLIESPKPVLKQIQQTILRDILNLMPPHFAAHGFRKNRDVISFIKEHVDKPFCLRMDLKDFFPSVSGGRVMGIFSSAGYRTDIASALANLCATSTPSDVVEQQRAPGERGACRISKLYLKPHLPQGAPTSPALANLTAYNLDCRLAGLANSHNVAYSRYADDILFSGDRSFARIAKQFSIFVGAIAIEEGFEVNFRKSRFQPSSQQQSATGIVLNQRPNLARREFDRLKAILNNCVKHGPESQNRLGHANFRQHLEGRILWAQRLNPNKARKLSKVFDRIQWSDVLVRIEQSKD